MRSKGRWPSPRSASRSGRVGRCATHSHAELSALSSGPNGPRSVVCLSASYGALSGTQPPSTDASHRPKRGALICRVPGGRGDDGAVASAPLPRHSDATIVSHVDDQELARRKPRAADVAALIGLLSRLEGQLMVPNDRDDSVPDWAQGLAARLSRDGLLDPEAGNRALRQTLNDLNHRLRYVLGEYDQPPIPGPVP
jgi:hypothetical protein